MQKKRHYFSEYRKLAGLTRMQTAIKLNVSYDTVNDWSYGRAIPNEENQKKISDLFQCNIENLFPKLKK